jgi:hypothetical protein
VRGRLPARGDRSGQANGPRRREMVRRFRPLPAVLQREPRLLHLYLGMPLVAPRRRAEPRGQVCKAGRAGVSGGKNKAVLTQSAQSRIVLRVSAAHRERIALRSERVT